MAAPELLNAVGFEKSKVGSGEKETGYQIKESSLASLLGSACVCFAVMGLLVVSMVYDIHFEKKTVHRQLRAEEHHAASKLAQVQMELWAQYHDDIKESQEAHTMLLDMNASYSELQVKLKGAVDELAAELNINPVKAAKFADKMLHIVAATQQANMKHAKHLVDHLVAVGKKSVKLEKAVDKEIVNEVKEERKREKEDKHDGIDVGVHEKHHVPNAKSAGKDGKKAGKDKKTNVYDDHDYDDDDDSRVSRNWEDGKEQKGGEKEDDPLKEMVEGFFITFNEFEREFTAAVKAKLQDGNPVFDQVKKLYGKIKAMEALGEEVITDELTKIDLASVGAKVESANNLPAADFVETLALVPKIPSKNLAQMETSWRRGETDTMDIFEQLSDMHERGVIPAAWLQMGVNQQQKEEEEAMEDMGDQE